MPWSEPQVRGLVVWMLAGAVLSLLVTAGVRRYAHAVGMLDLPGARRSHRMPTPRGGGLGIALAGLLGCLVLAPAAARNGLTAGLVCVAAAGWWDDRHGLAPHWRLLAQLLAGICLSQAVLALGASWSVVVLVFVAVPVLTNAWNFIDGIDGLAASQALLCALALGAWIDARWYGIAGMLVAGCLGFLPFNVPRASIFAGDVGSLALGYLLAAVLAGALLAQPPERWPVLSLPFSAVLTDTGLTLLWQIGSGQQWWQPHVQHAYQRWARKQGHAAVTLRYAGWTLGAGLLMWPTRWLSPMMAALLTVGVLCGAVVLWRCLHTRHADGVGA